MKRWPLLASFVMFVALCASATYWALQWFKPAARPVAAAPQPAAPELRLDAAAGLFGGRPAAVAASNFQLKGVVVASNPGESVAIVSADGKPAQALGVDAEIVPGVTVKEVSAQYVLLSEGGVVKRLELAEGAKSQGRMEMAPPQAPATQTVVPTTVGGRMPQAPEPYGGAPQQAPGVQPGRRGGPPGASGQ